MSDYERCTTCGEYGFTDTHTCDPQWLVLDLDNSDRGWDEAAVIYAADADSAAEKWAYREDRDSAEYSIVRGQPATVRVRPVGPVEVASVLLIVSGEAVPTYHAEAARSTRCSNYQCSAHRARLSIGDHEIGDACEDCGSAGRRGLWEATTMLPAGPTATEAQRAAKGLPL